MILEYKLNFNPIGEKRKYRLPRKQRLKIIDNSSWVENDLKNQWYFKDYKSYYIVISMFAKDRFRVSCSGANAGEYKTLEEAKVASIAFCDKIIL